MPNVIETSTYALDQSMPRPLRAPLRSFVWEPIRDVGRALGFIATALVAIACFAFALIGFTLWLFTHRDSR